MTKTIASTLAFFALAAPASASIDLSEATQAAAKAVEREATMIWRQHHKRDRVTWSVRRCHYVDDGAGVSCKIRIKVFRRDTDRVIGGCRGDAHVGGDLRVRLDRTCVG